MSGPKIKILTPFWILLIFLTVSLQSCTQNESKKVDQEYLDSEKYSSFNQEVIEERLEKAKNATMKSRLQQFSKCEYETLMRAPLSITEEDIVSVTEDTTDVCTVENNRQSLKLLGKSHFQNQTIRWVLFERQTAYQDQELYATTFREGKLQSFLTVGVYKENPSESIKTEIRVRKKDNSLYLASRTDRNLLYPIDQQNTVTTEYLIGADGSIRKL